LLSELEPIIFDAPAGRDVKIYPIADLHYGSMQFNMKRWEDFVTKIRNEDDSYIILAGDLIDNGTKSALTNCFDETCRPAEQKRWVAEQLKPLRDRVLCAVSGNHEARNKDVDDLPLYDICAKLDIEDRFRENGCFLAVRIGKDRNKNSTYRPAYSFCVTHGAGGGMYIGSALNRNERFVSAMDGVDVLITGHTHKPATFAGSKIVFDPQNKKVSTKQFYSVVASSWLNYGGYAMKKMYTPTAQTLTEIRLSSHGKDIRVTM
jgi:predicted phosphodiesterase